MQTLLDESERTRSAVEQHFKKLLQVDEEDEIELNEISFYLNEMREVKNRILASIFNSKKLGHCDTASGITQDGKDNFLIRMEPQYLRDKKTLILNTKDLVRKELEHLIILNSQSLDL